MKKSKLFYLMALVLMSTAIVFTSCGKDDDPEPTPAPVVDPCDSYLPAFSPTYITALNNTALDFYITCTTDDWEMIKVIVTYPGGLGSETYTGNGAIMTAGAPFTFTNYFQKLGGLWTFAITGNIKSGNCVGKSFTVMTSVNVSAK